MIFHNQYFHVITSYSIHYTKLYEDGECITCKSPEHAISKGFALCPEDRKEQGIIAIRSIKENTSIAILKSLVKGLFIDRKEEIKIGEKGKKDLNVKTPNIDKKIGELSGGNQQKVILARWLASNPKILILDEPTKGIDVGAKFEIYQIICNLAKQGIGVT